MARFISWGVSCLLFAGSSAVFPSVITVTQSPTGRAAFGGNDLVDWSQLVTPVSNPFAASSTGGISLTVSEAQGSFERVTQPASWVGNFSDGTVLLWTTGPNAPVDIVLGTAVKGLGFQINPDGLDTQTTVAVYGAGDVPFGSFNLTTANRSAPSADFIGFTSDAVDIARITIDQQPNHDFAINQLSLITGPSSAAEPGSLALVGIALAGLAFRRRKGGLE